MNGAAAGAVSLVGTYATTTSSTTFTVPSDITVVAATVVASTPVSVVPSGTNDAAVGNVNVTMPSAGQLNEVGGLASADSPIYTGICVVLTAGTSSNANFDAINGVPTITQINGAATNAVPGAAALTQTASDTAAPSNSVTQGNVLFFPVTVTGTPASAPEFTISNIHADGGTTANLNANATGAVTATIYQLPGSNAAAYTSANCLSSGSATGTNLGNGTVYVVGATSGAAIYGQSATDTTAAEFDTQFVKNGTTNTTTSGTYSCTDNGNAVLATSADPYDALAASYLEGQLSTGVLITSPTSLDAATLAALKLGGVSRVYVVGGLLAVSQADINQLQATPAYNCGGVTTTGSNIQVFSGISGATADDTAVAIDNYLGTPGTLSDSGAYATESTYNQTTGNETTATPNIGATAIIVSNADFHDAAAAAGIAYKYHLPVILTPGNALGAQASAELTKLDIQQAIVLGGQLAVQPAVVTSIQALLVNGAPISVLRIAGQDYTQTAADLALFEGQQLGWSDTTVLVAQGAGWSDALGSAALSGDNQESLFLTEGPVAGVGPYTLATLKTAGTLPNGLGSGPTSAIQVLGGFPESLLLQGLVLTLPLGVAALIRLREYRLRAALALVEGFGLGLAASAFLWVPFLTALSAEDIWNGPGTALRHLPGWADLTLFVPFGFGHWFDPRALTVVQWYQLGGYLGVVAAWLALAGLIGGWRRRPWLVTPLAVSVLVAMGWINGLPPFIWIGRLPGITQVSLGRLAVAELELAVAVLVALAVDLLVGWKACVGATVVCGGAIWLLVGEAPAGIAGLLLFPGVDSPPCSHFSRSDLTTIRTLLDLGSDALASLR